MREANSVLPRRLRRPLTNMRQRNSAMAFSWVDTGRPRFILGSFNCCTTSALAAAIRRNPCRANKVAGGGRRADQSYRIDSHCELHHERVLDGSQGDLYPACNTGMDCGGSGMSGSEEVPLWDSFTHPFASM